jgi:hypothetical protein
MEERRKIGYKNYENKNVSKDVEKIEENTEFSLAISPAQADLIESINNLADIISGKEFSAYADNQRISFVKQLITFTALNSELTSKTNLLLAK